MAFSVVDHGGKEGIGQGDNVAEAVLALGLLNHLFEGCETTDDDPLSPGLPVLLAKSSLDLAEDSQVLGGLGAGIDHLAETTNLEPLNWVLWEELSLGRIILLKELTDSH